MKEISDIIQAYKVAQQQGLQTALATVVQVEGSSYRREGARMLITETGQLTGAISGGCLEGDALRKALSAMAQQLPMLVTYDTNDEDDAKLGLGLGCNGIIHILIEPLNALETNNPIKLLEATSGKRQTAVAVTLFSLQNRRGKQPGSCLLIQSGKTIVRNLDDEALQEAIITEAKLAFERGKSVTFSYEDYTAFIEVLKPSVQLIIAGGGNDVIPLVQMAKILGWPVTVADGRSNYATAERFPVASCTIMAKPDALVQQVQWDEQTAVLLMTHNYNYDLAMLRLLLPLPIGYIGMLGPKKKLQRMLDEFAIEGIDPTNEQLEKVFGPTGLDIGAETAEEIAVSIVAEIKAVFSKKNGIMLREKKESIHQ
jgi:xanthine dehydrogenase accessory factor